MVYKILFTYTMSVFIFKFIILSLSYFAQTDWLATNSWMRDFEIYFDSSWNTKDILQTFLPNLALILVVSTVILFQSYTIEVKTNKILSYKTPIIIKFILKPGINLILWTFPITNLSFTSLLFVTANVGYVVAWSIRQESKRFFVTFCKILQVMCALTYSIEYLASIDSFQKRFDGDE